jgi:SAM-dependent methyltransferase
MIAPRDVDSVCLIRALRTTVRDFAATQARDLPAARRLRFSLAIEAVERFASGRPLRVLDAAGGEGPLGVRLARRHPTWQIVIGDLDASRLEIGRRRAGRELRNVIFTQMDLTHPIAGGLFDAVLAIEALEEIRDDDAALRTMAAALRPGGLFVVHVPESRWKPLLRRSETIWRHEVRHGYESGELADKLLAAGLEPRSIQLSSHGLVRLVQEARDAARGRHLGFHLLLLPAAVAAAGLEHHGLKWGAPRALIAEAIRA